MTDCYAVKFILLYDGANQAILCLQMRLMGWDVDIIHRNNNHLVDADYWSWLESNLCYDPSFCQYLHLVLELRCMHPPPTNLPMKAKKHAVLSWPAYPGRALPGRNQHG